MKKIIFKQLLKDVIKFFILTSLSLSLIIWVVQAVNFLDFISEDGHGLKTYFFYTLLNFPKVFSRILPFCIFVSVFYILNKYEVKNELLIFWNIGINKLKFINVLLILSIFFLIFQLFLNTILVPSSLDSARNFIRSSKIDFFPSLIKEKKFIDVVENLTIFVESKDDKGNLKNIYLKDQIKNAESQIIYAKSGKIISKNNQNFLILNNGSFIDINQKNMTNFSFKKTEVNLSNYSTKTTITPKFQEIKTTELIKCFLNLNYSKNYFITEKYFLCQENSFDSITEELFKRIIKPFFIPLIILISSLIIFSNKDSYKYSKFQYLLFSLGFFIIIISEISSRYLGNIKFETFITFPIIIFIFSYLLLILKLKNKIND